MPPKGSTKRKRVADESTNVSVVSGSGGSLGHRVQRSPDDLVKVLEMYVHFRLLFARTHAKQVTTILDSGLGIRACWTYVCLPKAARFAV